MDKKALRLPLNQLEHVTFIFDGALGVQTNVKESLTTIFSAFNPEATRFMEENKDKTPHFGKTVIFLPPGEFAKHIGGAISKVANDFPNSKIVVETGKISLPDLGSGFFKASICIIFHSTSRNELIVLDNSEVPLILV